MYTSIEKNTEANMQSNPSIAQNVAIFQQIAETIGNDLAQNGLTLPDKNGHPQEIHIEIKTEPSTVWNKETQQKEPRLDRNGNQMTDYIASINRSSETLKIFAVPDREKGMRLAGMFLSKWTKNPETNKMFPKHYKVTEIADSPVSDEMKAVSSFLQGQGYIQSKQQNTPQSQWNRPQSSPMFEHTRELNQMFRERSENPENAEAFAKEW